MAVSTSGYTNLVNGTHALKGWKSFPAKSPKSLAMVTSGEARNTSGAQLEPYQQPARLYSNVCSHFEMLGFGGFAVVL